MFVESTQTLDSVSVLISSHEYMPRKIAWVRALLRQASHIQLFQERLSYWKV